MVKNLFSLALICISVSTPAKVLENSQLHSVPNDEKWEVTTIKRYDCDVCTSDIYVQSGSARINGVWVSGTFDFSLNKESEVVFNNNSVFALGDVVQSIEVTQQNTK
ncbi:hypothetical protein [Vibrio sp. NH-UV-68]|uniref:hypothetical protein n=1 Tax=unclassified Vibrio TaxID=2614977 RepID=UPI0036F3018B